MLTMLNASAGTQRIFGLVRLGSMDGNRSATAVESPVLKNGAHAMEIGEGGTGQGSVRQNPRWPSDSDSPRQWGVASQT